MRSDNFHRVYCKHFVVGVQIQIVRHSVVIVIIIVLLYRVSFTLYMHASANAAVLKYRCQNLNWQNIWL